MQAVTPLPRTFQIAAFVAAAIVLGVTALTMSGSRPGAATFVVSTPPALASGDRRDFSPHPPARGAAHAATATLMDDGRIALFWFAGSREGAGDVVLLNAVFDGSTWSRPRIVTDAVRTGADERRHVKTVGNPVVFRHPNGEYWLIYVSVSYGGWSGSALNLMRSADGVTWGPARRLVTSPFFNLSTLVRSPPLMRSDGLVALPAYHEMIAGFPEMIFLNAGGNVVDRVRFGGACSIQPWAVPTGGGGAVALMRQHRCRERVLFRSATDDGGASWTRPRATSLANPGSPAAAVRLADGRIVAVLNDDPISATHLDLVVSSDNGATWRHGATVFDGTAERKTYRYPWLLLDKAGRLHVFVSESKNAIRHAILDGQSVVPK
jgi:predicted neuraminidase